MNLPAWRRERVESLSVGQGYQDAELIHKLQTGSLDALGVLYDRHRHLVFRTALAITGDLEAAADLLQDVFLRLHRFAHRIDPGRPLEPWLYRMTTNLSYTWVKRHHRWLRPLEDIAEWLVGASRGDTLLSRVDSQYEVDEMMRQVHQAVSSLPLSHRGVVVLYYINDLSLQEISEILEIPVGTVKSRLHYGRQALKAQLGILEGDGSGRSDSLPEMRYEFT
jgi:RNA polymerase sigma-70 factor (ECF subfamily)